MTDFTSAALFRGQRCRSTGLKVGNPIALAVLLILLIGVQLALVAAWPGIFDLAADPAAFTTAAP